jgi:hypothetical protein
MENIETIVDENPVVLPLKKRKTVIHDSHYQQLYAVPLRPPVTKTTIVEKEKDNES